MVRLESCGGFMITLSLPIGLLVLYLISVPIYIGIGGWSFKYYSLKANSSSGEIEDFKRQLHFPANLIVRENSAVPTLILGTNFASSDLNHARSQRMLIVIIFGIWHIPIFIAMLFRNNVFEVMCCAIFLLTSIITIIICMRFGHKLLVSS